MQKELERILDLFNIEGEFIDYQKIQMGNINTTYRVTWRKPDGTVKNYIAQKVNTYVFKNPIEIMTNIDLVTTHIREKNAAAGLCRPTLHYHHTRDGRLTYCFDTDGGFWRLCNYIDSLTFNECEDLDILRNAGRAFGEFQTQLSDFQASKLNETIVDFHNTKKRLAKLFEDVALDSEGRASEMREEIAYIASLREKASRLTEMQERGELPIRVTHNDTKINNVLFDARTKAPLVVVDLDTVMPGLVAHDFGDAVRFAANTAAEDEPDLGKVALDQGRFRAFTEGFVGATSKAMTDAELSSLTLGALTITVELASRFLDDYLTGDRYFKTDYPGHNAVRTRCQLRLAKSIENQYDQLDAIVHEVAGR